MSRRAGELPRGDCFSFARIAASDRIASSLLASDGRCYD
jgi:hypothetical protein